MKIDEKLLVKLREHDKIYEFVTEEQIQRGLFLSKSVKDFDRPEDTLDKENLFCLSAYYEYLAKVNSDLLKDVEFNDGYEFDLGDDDDEEE